MNSPATSVTFVHEQSEQMRRARKTWTLKDAAKAQKQAAENRSMRLQAENVTPELTVFRVSKS